jgi:hypothetical protein
VSRPTPERAHAQGMLDGILAQRRMEGLTGPHPYDTLDLDDPVDRRIVGSVYALMARAAQRGL